VLHNRLSCSAAPSRLRPLPISLRRTRMGCIGD
jgi:hypothetical protein